MEGAMYPKLINMGLWIGGPDRGMIVAGALDPVTYFGQGKTLMINKATQTLAAVKTLVSLLETHSYMLSAKSYGRGVRIL